MPHQCTTCDRTFPDGSKEMLSGCPDCGGNKFQFTPATTQRSASEGSADGSSDAAASETRARADPAGDSSGAADDSTTATSGPSQWPSTGQPTADESARLDDSTDEFSEWPASARRPVEKDRPSSGSETADDRNRPQTTDADVDRDQDAPGDDTEDAAQASARSAVVSSDELPSRSPSSDSSPPSDANSPAPDSGRVVSEPQTDEQPSLEDLREELNDQFESIKIVRPGEYELNLMELYDREEYIVSLQEDGRYVIDVPDSWRDADDS